MPRYSVPDVMYWNSTTQYCSTGTTITDISTHLCALMSRHCVSTPGPILHQESKFRSGHWISAHYIRMSIPWWPNCLYPSSTLAHPHSRLQVSAVPPYSPAGVRMAGSLPSPREPSQSPSTQKAVVISTTRLQ